MRKRKRGLVPRWCAPGQHHYEGVEPDRHNHCAAHKDESCMACTPDRCSSCRKEVDGPWELDQQDQCVACRTLATEHFSREATAQPPARTEPSGALRSADQFHEISPRVRG